MLSIKTKELQVWLITILVTLLSTSRVLAQQIEVNRTYDLGQSMIHLNNKFDFVYADTDRIFAMGETFLNGGDSCAFIAAFGYSGNLLWQKKLVLPNGLISTDEGLNNLKKVSSNLYVALGNIANVPKSPDTTGKVPFLYFFNAQGDSVNYVQFPSDSLINQRMTAIAIDTNGDIIAGGDKFLIENPDSKTYLRKYWFARIKDTGRIIDQNEFNIGFVQNGQLSYQLAPNPDVVNIIPVSWDSIGFLVTGNNYCPYIQVATLLEIDKSLNKISSSALYTSISSDFNSSLMKVGHAQKFNFIPMKGTDFSFYWSLPAKNIPYPTNPFGEGIYYTKIQWHNPSFSGYYHMEWERSLYLDTAHLPNTYYPNIAQKRNSLTQAINGDILMLQEAERPSGLSAQGYRLPALYRIDSSGNTRSAMIFQHVISEDTGITQYLSDISIAPNGKIVMAGFVKSNYGISGYDTTGKVSWLIILNDSVHDYGNSSGILLDNKNSNAMISAYPNPTTSSVFIDLKNFQGEPHKICIQICDINGRVLQNHQLNSKKEVISLQSYSRGIYFFKVWLHDKWLGSFKIIKD